MKYSYILFDLDGTLLNTNELILQSFEYTLDIFFPGRFTRKDLLPYMGEPLIKQFSRWAEPEMVPSMVQTYRKYNLDNHDRLIASFPYVREVVDKLSREGYKMAVVTSKIKLTAEMGLRHFQLDPYMETVVTVEDTEKHKPDPEPLQLAMRRLGATPEKTIMVGDSPHDILGGKAAGTSTCGVAWSMRGAAGLQPYEPDYLINDMQELFAIMRG